MLFNTKHILRAKFEFFTWRFSEIKHGRYLEGLYYIVLPAAIKQASEQFAVAGIE